MLEYLEITVDKFTFRVAKDRLYTAGGVWVLPGSTQSAPHVRIGVTDYLQQHNGDVAFANVRPQGTTVKAGDDCADLETMKVNLDLPSPVTGTIVEANKVLELTPEVINQDPYGQGWLAVIEATNWDSDRANLLEPSAYLAVMQAQAEEELKS